MDIVTHAFVGAATGMQFGMPVTGAIVATMPDWPLAGFKRPCWPPPLYTATHSMAAVLTATVVAYALFGGQVATLVALAWLSHLALDVVTHGYRWEPQLLYPYRARTGLFAEWEWFNGSWWRGFSVAALWSLLCVLL